MTQPPAIVTFANQKGGVGKTTLCVTFANYLVTKGVRVAVVDCDFQHSIVKCRRADIKRYGNDLVPYDVVSQEVNDRQAMIAFTEKLHNDPGIDVALMDAPGSLTAPGLVPLFVNSDLIVVPFHYDLTTIPSTASFLMFIDKLRRSVGARMKARLYIVPNRCDGRVGKRAELIVWEKTRETFSNYGQVTTKLPTRADMERFSTIAALDRQSGITGPVFGRIYEGIFGTTEPQRETALTGIQLTENADPDSKKRKSRRENAPVTGQSEGAANAADTAGLTAEEERSGEEPAPSNPKNREP